MHSVTDDLASIRNHARSVVATACIAMLVGCGAGANDAANEREFAAVSQGATAPAWMLGVEDTGTWTTAEDGEHDVVYAWVDASVANVRYHKRVLVEVLAPYEGGAFMRTLHPASYRASLGNGRERWGADSIEIYPSGGPGGSSLAGPVSARIRFQHDLDGDGTDEMLLTQWQTVYGSGAPVLPTEDPWDGGLSSPVLSTADQAGAQVSWAPYDDPGQDVIARIDEIIAAQNETPAQRHTLHAAVFNITDPGIVDKLIEAHRAGVEVRLLCDGRKFRPWYDWYDGDDRLLAAGVPLLGVRRDGTGSMHDKIALFDGRTVATGSFNWEWGARFENHENMLVTARREVVSAYAQRFETIAGGVERPRVDAIDTSGTASVSFAPDEEPYRIVGRLIDEASSSIHVAMFTAKDVTYTEDGVGTSLLGKLAAAVARGVEVTVIVDYGIHEASEYHGVVSEDDPSDEWLEERGVHVVRADNPNGQYASMHHKFLVIDGAITVTGAFNWYYDAAYRNDEDQIVWRDARLARDFDGEFVGMLMRYDEAFDAASWPSVQLTFDALHDGTKWGDAVAVVGNDASLGNWTPQDALMLDASAWPRWRGSVEVPRGARVDFKLIVLGSDGTVAWESGANRKLRAAVEGDGMEVPMAYRR